MMHFLPLLTIFSAAAVLADHMSANKHPSPPELKHRFIMQMSDDRLWMGSLVAVPYENDTYAFVAEANHTGGPTQFWLKSHKHDYDSLKMHMHGKQYRLHASATPDFPVRNGSITPIFATTAKQIPQWLGDGNTMFHVGDEDVFGGSNHFDLLGCTETIGGVEGRFLHWGPRSKANGRSDNCEIVSLSRECAIPGSTGCWASVKKD